MRTKTDRENEAFLKSNFFKGCDFKVNSDRRAILTTDNKFVMNCYDYHNVRNLISILKLKKEIYIAPCR